MALKQVQPVLAFAATHFDEDVSLRALAHAARLSAFHLHRKFVAVTGETPKQFTLRIRLARAAAMLLANRDESILNVALACGFQNHETFSRMFRRCFGMSPSTYRKQCSLHDADQAIANESQVARAAPCLALYRYLEIPERTSMSYTITKRTIDPQHALVMQRRVKQSEIAQTIGEVLPRVFMHAQAAGVPFIGPPLTRYVEWGPGLLTIQPGMPVATLPAAANADAEILPITLPGGLVAATTHMGPYDRLTEAYAAMQQWIESEGLKIAGPPWESYVTDPADYPDSKDWKTDIFWPVTEG